METWTHFNTVSSFRFMWVSNARSSRTQRNLCDASPRSNWFINAQCHIQAKTHWYSNELMGEKPLEDTCCGVNLSPMEHSGDFFSDKKLEKQKNWRQCVWNKRGEMPGGERVEEQCETSRGVGDKKPSFLSLRLLVGGGVLTMGGRWVTMRAFVLTQLPLCVPFLMGAAVRKWGRVRSFRW